MTGIDLFAGLGGFTCGASMAGIDVVWAGNHWQAAVDQHRLNHPKISHVCQDLHQADWSIVPAHDISLNAPACQGHAWARGAERSHHDACRSTAWAVVSCAEYHRPQFVVVENVVEMMAWKLYRAWRFAMQALGYAISENVVDAADFGIPQHRVRLLIVCVLGKYAFHLKKPRSTIVTARDVIDFEFGRWSAVHRKGRAAATLSRYATGRKRFGERFVMPFYGSGSGTTGRSLDRPIGTITTRDRWAVVDGDRMRMVSVSEAAAFMSFPSSYQLPESSRLAMHMLGNAVPPRMACEAIRQILRSA